MIQIIKEGMTKQVTCKNCGAVLSYNKEDIKYPEQQYTIGYGGYYVIPMQRGTITCPQCNYRIDV